MALNLFKKIEAPSGLFAVEKINLLYNLFTSILIFILFDRMGHPGSMLADRFLIVLMTFGMMLLYRVYPCKMTTLIRIAVQMALLSYWYPDTFEFNRLFPNLDYIFAGTEQHLFGCQPAALFCLKFPNKWVSECFNLGYFSYYPMIITVGIAFFIKRFDLFEKWSFIVSMSFFVYYIIFIFVPVAGPQFYYPAIGAEDVAAGIFPALGSYFDYNCTLFPGSEIGHGFFHHLVVASQTVGERPTAAFPSSHVAVSTILMILAGKIHRNLVCFLLPFYILLCGATVYIQAHYLTDAIVGFVTSFFVFFLSQWAYRKWFVTPISCEWRER